MVLFVIGTFTVLLLLAWGTYQTAGYLKRVVITFNPLLLPLENLMRLALVTICIWLGVISGLPYRDLGWDLQNAGRDVVLGLAVGIVISILVPLVTQWAIVHFGNQVYSPIVVYSVIPRTRQEWLAVPLSLVSAVLLEELLFRSLLLGGFSRFAPAILLAVLWSIVFGSMHLPQGQLGVAVAAGLGLLLSGLFLATASLVAPLVAHYVTNVLELVWASLDKSWMQRYGYSTQPPADQ